MIELPPQAFSWVGEQGVGGRLRAVLLEFFAASWRRLAAALACGTAAAGALERPLGLWLAEGGGRARTGQAQLTRQPDHGFGRLKAASSSSHQTNAIISVLYTT